MSELPERITKIVSETMPRWLNFEILDVTPDDNIRWKAVRYDLRGGFREFCLFLHEWDLTNIEGCLIVLEWVNNCRNEFRDELVKIEKGLQ
jgi:hypothetical protein